jgi:hypothetical protein
MSSEDLDYLSNYKPETLYTHPGKQGAYATLVSENEEVLAEIEVTERSRVAVSAFYVNDRRDYGSFKIVKLKYHKTYGWREDGAIRVNHFHLAHMRQFIAVLEALDLHDSPKARIALGNIQIEALRTLLSSSRGPQLVQELSQAPELHDDIYAVAAKRLALAEFERNLDASISEGEWQAFFEANTWIFGHGLNYVFLEKVAKKLEAVTVGSEFDQGGKRSDGLMRTRAEVSQYVLIEIKRSDTDLLQEFSYRTGCWAASDEMSAAVTQIQKTVFEFTRSRFRDRMKDSLGNDLGGDIYAVDPRSYLVVGNLSQLQWNDDKVTCFELYRRNVRAPEIITFDELFYRARCIVENIDRRIDG